MGGRGHLLSWLSGDAPPRWVYYERRGAQWGATYCRDRAHRFESYSEAVYEYLEIHRCSDHYEEFLRSGQVLVQEELTMELPLGR